MLLNYDWDRYLAPILRTWEFEKLDKRLVDEVAHGRAIFPRREQVFKCFDYFKPHETKVVILGQDPYHTPGLATGLAFSIPEDQDMPPSLKNIQKELMSEGFIMNSKTLRGWAKQGVLLLNTILTVSPRGPLSHKDYGWQQFTRRIVYQLAKDFPNIVFVLWGKEAQKFALFPAGHSYKIIMSPHPSPLSANKGFFGSKPFSKINTALEINGLEPIDWSL